MPFLIFLSQYRFMEPTIEAGPGSRAHSAAEPQFLWIENDGLLRDEGVVFGLSGADGAALAHKEEAIRAYYRSCMAAAGRRALLLQGEMEALSSARAERLQAVQPPAHAPSPDGDAAEDEAAPGLLVRHAFGVVAASLACAGTTVLAWEQLRPHFAFPAMVTAGVVAAGFFTSFLPVSLLFVADARRRPGAVELWKVRLAEFGVPLVAAVFVVAWAWSGLGAARASSLATLLFLVFAFAGRQVLSGILRVSALWRARARAAVLAADAQAARAEVRGLDERLAVLRREVHNLRTPAEWDAIRDAKLALFRSEYELAAGARNVSAGAGHLAMGAV